MVEFKFFNNVLPPALLVMPRYFYKQCYHERRGGLRASYVAQPRRRVTTSLFRNLSDKAVILVTASGFL